VAEGLVEVVAVVVAVVGEASYTVEVVVFPFEAAFDIVEACKLLEELVDLVAVVVSFDQAYLDVVVGPFDIDLVEVAGLAVGAPSLAFVDVAVLAVVVVVAASSFEDVVDMDCMAVVVEPSLVVVVVVDLELQVVVVASDLVDSSSSFEDAVAAVVVVVVVVEASFVVDKDYTFVVAVAVEVVDLVPFDSLLVVVVVAVAFVVAFAVAVVVAVELLLFVFCQFLVRVTKFEPQLMVCLDMLSKLNKLDLYAIFFEDQEYLAFGPC